MPFNEEKYYHEYCDITENDFKTNNQDVIEKCRLYSLPDLHTEKEEVKAILFKWIIDDVMLKYGFDGMRIDTVRHINKRFWLELNVVLNPLQTFTVGEVMDKQTQYVANYQ